METADLPGLAKGADLKLLSVTPGCEKIVAQEGDGEYLIPELGVYSMLVVEP